MPICSMVLEYLPTFAPTKSPSFVRRWVHQHHGAYGYSDLEVFWNTGTPKSSILIGCSIINHPFWDTPFMETSINIYIYIAFPNVNRYQLVQAEAAAALAAVVSASTAGDGSWGINQMLFSPRKIAILWEFNGELSNKKWWFKPTNYDLWVN